MMFLKEASFDEHTELCTQHFEEWGGRLDVGKYVELNKTLIRTSFDQETNFTCYVLKNQQEELQNTRILSSSSSLELHRLPSIFNGKQGYSYVIASVFTPQEQRKKGFATNLVSQVIQKIKVSDPLSQAVILFSDVGDFYTRSGFSACQTVPGINLLFPALPTEPYNEAVSFVNNSEYEQYWHQLITKHFESTSQGYFIMPLFSKLHWHEVLDSYFGSKLPTFCGAKSKTCIAFWTANHREGFLDIQILIGTDTEGLANVIKEARKAAAEIQVENVRVWADGTETFQSIEKAGWVISNKGLICDRGRCLPMIAPICADIKPNDWTFSPHLLCL